MKKNKEFIYVRSDYDLAFKINNDNKLSVYGKTLELATRIILNSWVLSSIENPSRGILVGVSGARTFLKI